MQKVAAAVRISLPTALVCPHPVLFSRRSIDGHSGCSRELWGVLPPRPWMEEALSGRPVFLILTWHVPAEAFLDRPLSLLLSSEATAAPFSVISLPATVSKPGHRLCLLVLAAAAVGAVGSHGSGLHPPRDRWFLCRRSCRHRSRFCRPDVDSVTRRGENGCAQRVSLLCLANFHRA